MGRFICITSIPKLDAEELPELLSEVSELEEASMEYLTLFFLLSFLETLSFNLLDGGCVGGMLRNIHCLLLIRSNTHQSFSTYHR